MNGRKQKNSSIIKLQVTFNHSLTIVNACAWSPWEYGLILAAGSSDGTISVITHLPEDNWDLSPLEGHKGGVTSISWGPSTYPTMLKVFKIDNEIES